MLNYKSGHPYIVSSMYNIRHRALIMTDNKYLKTIKKTILIENWYPRKVIEKLWGIC